MLHFTEEDRKVLRSTTPELLTAEFEKREKLLLKTVSENYLSIINKCKSIREYEISTNISRLKEVAYKIMSSKESLEVNKCALKKAEKVMSQIVLLLRIVRSLADKDEDLLYEKMKKLLFVQREKEAFRSYRFYGQVEKIYKNRLVSLSRRVELEVNEWRDFIKISSNTISKEIMQRIRNAGRDIKSVIFNEFYSIKSLLDLQRVLIPLYISKQFNFHADPFRTSYSKVEEVLSFALSFLFLKEKKLVEKSFDYGQVDVHTLRLIRRLFEAMDSNSSEIEKDEERLVMRFLKENEGVLEQGVMEYVDFCREVGNYEEQAEIIDSYLCRILIDSEQDVDSLLESPDNLSPENKDFKGGKMQNAMERVRKELRYLKKENAAFNIYGWNAEEMIKQFTGRIEKSIFASKKKAVCEIFKKDSGFAQEIIKELRGVDKGVAEMLSSVIKDKYHEKMVGDIKERRIISGDALVVIKYYKDNHIPVQVLEELAL